MDERLKHLMQDLGNAINDTLSDSDGIAEVIGQIKKEGYDVFLVLEATVGFDRRVEDEDKRVGDEAFVPSEVSFSPQDHAFLRALKITMDE